MLTSRIARTFARRSDLGRLARGGGLAPLTVAATLLILGYARHAPGTDHPNDYHIYSFSTLNYTDIIWLYLRDRVAGHPRPYLDYPLEYPPLTGGLSYLFGFAPNLRAYFALACAVLALGGLATVAALGRLPGANRWWFAATPALLVYGMLNWDLAAVGMTALALLAYSRGRDAWGTLALVAAIWLKLFPIVFLGAILIERLRERRWRRSRRSSASSRWGAWRSTCHWRWRIVPGGAISSLSTTRARPSRASGRCCPA